MPKITIMDKIYLELYLKGREVTVDDLMKLTKLKPHQVYRALWRLKQRDKIIKRHTKLKAGYAKPPTGPLYVKVKNPDYAEKYLRKKGVI